MVVESGVCGCGRGGSKDHGRVASPAPGMSSHELAEHVMLLCERAQERVLGVGMRQYDDGIAGQRFESYTVDRLLTELQDELVDVINYTSMLSIMVERAVTNAMREGGTEME